MAPAPPFTITGVVDAAGTLAVESVEGHQAFADNAALVTNLAAYGRHELMSRRARAQEKKASHAKQGDRHRLQALSIAAMELDARPTGPWVGWCSGCFARTSHRKVRTRGRRTTGYLCGS